MNRLTIAAVLCVWAVTCHLNGRAVCHADEGTGDRPPIAAARVPDSRRDVARSNARRVATEKRREWLRTKLTAELHDANAIVQLNARLDALNDQQIDIAAARLLEQLDQRAVAESAARANGDLARALETREALRRIAAARHAAASSPVGFFPVITVLPQGASLTASAVVSPDRRHVRVNVNPFFSSIGPVDAFNFSTGEYYRMPEYDSHQHQPPTSVSPRYDGLRTRNDIAPRR